MSGKGHTGFLAGDMENMGKTGASQVEVGRKRGKSDTSRRAGVCVLTAIAVVLLIFPVVTIPILFTLYARLSSRQSYSQGTTAYASFMATVNSAVTPLVGGVSFTSMATVQAGAGTSIYRNVGPLPLESCPEYLSGSAVFDDKFLISYKDLKTGTGSISVMQMNSSRKAVTLTSSSNIHDLYHVVTLDQGSGLFVSISQQTTSISPSNAVVIAGRSDANNKFQIKYGVPTAYGINTDASIDPSLASLSNTTFALTFYNGNYSYTRYGTVNPTTLAVKLSPLLVVGDNSNYGLTVAITGLTATQYMVIYYGGFRMSPTSLYAVVVKGNVRSNGTLSVGMPVAAKAFPGYSLNGYFKATTLDSGDVVVAYADSNVNQGVVCALLTVNINTGAILNGPQLTIATGSSLASYSAISIVTIGTGSQFMVMFADLIVNRAVVAAIGQSTKTSLIRVSPNYLMNAGISSGYPFYTFLSLAVSSATPFYSRVAILSSITQLNCATAPITDFSFMEILPKPLGVMTVKGLSASPQSASVALSGLASGFSGLVVGETYYTTTSGKVVTDGGLFGQSDTTATDAAVEGYFYVNDIVDKVVVSSDSILGIAVASDTILLRLA